MGTLIASYDYQNKKDDNKDLSFKAGDHIKVIRPKKHDENWWVGQDKLGNIGTFPITHIEQNSEYSRLIELRK